MGGLKLAALAQVLLISLLIILSAPPLSSTSPGLGIIQQPTSTSKYVTAFRLAASNLSLSPIIVYPTSTVVWVLAAQSINPPYYSQILAFTPKPQPRFTVNVSLTGVFVSSSITVNPQGRVWYGVGAMLAYYDPSTGRNQTVARFPGTSLGYLTVDSQSRVWATLAGVNRVGFYDPTKPGNTTTTYPVPTSTPGLQGIAGAPDGTIWFAEASAKKLGRLDPNTSIITEYTGPPDVAAPYQLAVDSKGVVWYSDHASSDFGSYNPASGEWRKIPVGYCLGDCIIALPNAIAVANGRVWFSEHLRGVIGGYDSLSNLLVEYTIPLPPSNTRQYPATWWAMPGPSNLVWFADEDFREIGYVNATIPLPLTISTGTSVSAFQGERISVPVTVDYQGSGSVSLGVSTTSFDTRYSQVTGFAQNLTTTAYPSQTSARFLVGWSTSLQSRYVTVTAQGGQVAVSIPVRLTVRTAYLTIGVALGLTGTAVFLYRRQRRNNREESADETDGPSISTGEDVHPVPE